MSLAELGSRGANLEKFESQTLFTGSRWLLREDEWPEQQELKKFKETLNEQKVTQPVYSSVISVKRTNGTIY